MCWTVFVWQHRRGWAAAKIGDDSVHATRATKGTKSNPVPQTQQFIAVRKERGRSYLLGPAQRRSEPSPSTRQTRRRWPPSSAASAIAERPGQQSVQGRSWSFDELHAYPAGQDADVALLIWRKQALVSRQPCVSPHRSGPLVTGPRPAGSARRHTWPSRSTSMGFRGRFAPCGRYGGRNSDRRRRTVRTSFRGIHKCGRSPGCVTPGGGLMPGQLDMLRRGWRDVRAVKVSKLVGRHVSGSFPRRSRRGP